MIMTTVWKAFGAREVAPIADTVFPLLPMFWPLPGKPALSDGGTWNLGQTLGQKGVTPAGKGRQVFRPGLTGP